MQHTTTLGRRIAHIALPIVFVLCSSVGCSGQTKDPTAPPVRQVDHIMIKTDDPSTLYAFFTETLELPVAWPLASRRGVTSGGASFGNANVEAIQFPEQKMSRAHLVGFGFEPAPLAESLAELSRRGIPYGEPRPFVMTEQDGSKKTLFTNVTLQQFSDADRPAGATIHIFLSEYSPTYVNVEQRRERLGKELRAKGGGPLGIDAVKEIIIGTKDLGGATKLWENLLEPASNSGTAVWKVGNGPAIRLVQASENKLQALVISVVSLRRAKAFLQERGLLGSMTKNEVRIDASKIQGIDIRLVENK
jgi:hypothetical protein